MKSKQLWISVVSIMAMAFIASSCAPKLTIAEFRQGTLDSNTASHQLPQYATDKKKPKVAVLPPSDATQFKGKCNLVSCP